MKSVGIFLIFIAVSYAFEEQCPVAVLKKVMDICITINGGDKVHIEDVLNIKKARDEHGKCFRACVMAECKYFNDDRKIREDAPKRIAHFLNGGDEKTFKAIEDAATKCLGLIKYEENVCNNADSYSRCFVKQCSSCNLNLHKIFD